MCCSPSTTSRLRGAFAHHEPDRVKPTRTLASFACSAPRLRRRILRAIKAGDTIWQSRWQPGGDCLVDIALLGREAGRSAAVAWSGWLLVRAAAIGRDRHRRTVPLI